MTMSKEILDVNHDSVVICKTKVMKPPHISPSQWAKFWQMVTTTIAAIPLR